MIPVIKKGKILTYRLYDTAFEIDLLKVEEKYKKRDQALQDKEETVQQGLRIYQPAGFLSVADFRKRIYRKKTQYKRPCQGIRLRRSQHHTRNPGN